MPADVAGSVHGSIDTSATANSDMSRDGRVRFLSVGE
jgi:hypothetical protein